MSDPIEPRVRAAMNQLALALDRSINGDDVLRTGKRHTGFLLLVFPFGEVEGARCNWITNNVNLADVPTLLREMADRFERGE